MNWYKNSAYVITEARIIDGGYGFPKSQVILTGGGGSGAVPKTHPGANGTVQLVEIINEGGGYYPRPILHYKWIL